MLYAIRNDNGARHFFEWNKTDEWATRAELDAAIAEWKKTVSPNYAARIQFEIYETKRP